MKRTVYILLLSITILSLTGCGKQQDTGIIISAQDNGNDSSQNKLLDTNESTPMPDEVEEAEDIEVVDIEIEVEEEYYIIGTWTSGNGDIFGFTNKNTFTHYNPEKGSNVSGMFDTDSKSYLKLTYNNLNEIVVDENGVEMLVPLPDVTVDYKIKEFEVAKNKIDATLVLLVDDTELILNRPSSIPANSLENLQIKVDEKINAPVVSEEDIPEVVISTETIILYDPSSTEESTENLDNITE